MAKYAQRAYRERKSSFQLTAKIWSIIEQIKMHFRKNTNHYTGLKPDALKIEVIMQIPYSKCKKDLRRFLGMAN